MKISFSISVWEKSYIRVLLSGWLKNQLDIINYNFDNKSIIINDVNNADRVKELCHSMFPDFNVYYVNEDSDDVLKYFDLTKENTVSGYWYSIHHWNQFYHSNADYNFYLSDDCEIRKFDNNFIDDSIRIMESRDDIIVSSPSWDFSNGAPKAESLFEIDDFYAGLGFADHVYLAKNKIFKSKIYNYKHAISDRYPEYGKDSFERRVDSYMQTEKKYRMINKNSYYFHNKFV